MTPADLRALPSTAAANLPPLPRALWHDAHGDWDRAHALAQDDDSPEAARLHAYLHRREDDDSNARYWYRRAAQPVFPGSLDDEWHALATAFLAGSA